MKLPILVLGLSTLLLIGSCDHIVKTTPLANLSNTGKDMYVINAMVYQVGILTNKTDKDAMNSTGNQESVTFYHTNGTKIDLSKISAPLLTNVTAQSIVGLAPTTKVSENVDKPSTWSTLSHVASLQQPSSFVQSDSFENLRASNNKQSLDNDTRASKGSGDISNLLQMKTVYKRSMNNISKTLFQRDLTSNVKNHVKIVNGAALVPPDVGIQSIALPPLLTLNNNLSQIPVPIPNTSIVHYAKINTLVRMP